MQVVQVTKFGGPEVLAAAQLPDPVAGAGEVVIATAAADVLFLDTMVRGGGGGEFFPVQPPYVPGGGVVGEVVAAGQGADPALLGTTVIARLSGGGYAERVAVAADRAHRVPAGVDPRLAVALLHDGVTALSLAERGRIQPGERVLVTAAGGGLGLLLVQLAKAAGAQVVGAARGERKLALIRAQGADAVVDYSEEDWTERVREATGGRGLDLVLDGAGGQVGAAAFALTANGGRFSAHGTPSGEFAPVEAEEAARRGITLWGIEAVQFDPEEDARLTAQVLAEAAAGRLRPVIGQTFPLSAAAEAHAAIESRRALGKTLLLI
ncbi:NADPH2:quinone reductase [Amycolatopsis marina]|uniref:NADPH2:quinone reductase n=2 Tax=Amycolatopsis marina TaxID=490629 RepID=A0A1I0ZQ39_9PSEU|nr:zinc-binding dehydrogenase [Amycolatopsis marina]SFB27472.1 NADPH2:quinone reductase [Amycolatopsis marina]